ncbi:hypothetical protein M0R88_09360 [Halorussus gelatinilyticus]|uniref:Uncharacterized protein n=1 Tax=Halorussus gelatinilyticus TaxID=2937524 RepID=A0A8U0IMA7_9EURY|nr:hypothetical protein [Halorussus gelatinilyticus]UPW02280.1 hypothetical protein M0R88_09360 [Halorussus gelatinilyticus]
MTETHKRARCAFAIAVICWSLVAPAAATQTQTEESSPETADEFLDAFRGLEGHPAFQEYSEFEVVRAQAVSTVQVGTFTDAKAERMRLVYEVLVTFDEAYNLSQSGSRIESLERANRTEALVADLRAAGGSQYAALTTLALDRFYQNQGEALHQAALATNDTRSRLDLMKSAATAYKRGGAVQQYSNLVVQRERLQATYQTDVETLNESVAAAGEFLDSCRESCDSAVGALTTHTLSVFDRYASARAASDRLVTAADVTAEHGLSDRAERISEMRERTQSAVASLALASAMLALGFAAAVALVAGLFAHRLTAWARDVDDAQIGDIVATEGVRHG